MIAVSKSNQSQRSESHYLHEVPPWPPDIDRLLAAADLGQELTAAEAERLDAAIRRQASLVRAARERFLDELQNGQPPP